MPASTTNAPKRQSSAHTGPLDALHLALAGTHCRLCRMWLWVLRRHIERDVPAFYPRRAGR